MVLQQNESYQLRPEMASDALRQRRHHRAAIRPHPAFPAVADHLRAQHQILDDEGVVSFEPRARRHVHPEHLALDADPRYGLAASTMLAMARRLRRRRIDHAAWLDIGTAFQTLQSRDLLALLRHNTLQLGNLAKQFDDQGFEFGPRKVCEIARRGHALSESYCTAPRESPKCLPPTVLPRLRELDPK